MENQTSIGSFRVTSGKLYLSDPCYSRGRPDLVGTVENAHKGFWEASVEYNEEGRVKYLIAIARSLPTNPGESEVIEGLCVDSGQMGIYDDVKFPEDIGEYEDTETFYGKVCELTQSPSRAGIVGKFGVVSSSGWGDGQYSAVVTRDKKGVARYVCVDFGLDYEEEEDVDESCVDGTYKPFDIRDLCDKV